MPHSIILLNQCADSLRGNATTGSIKELQDEFNRVEYLVENDPEHEAHELMENIQSWLCDGGTFSMGASGQCEYFIEELGKYE